MKRLSNFLTLLFLTLLAFYFFRNKDALSQLLDVSAWAIITLAALKILKVFVSGLLTKFAVQPLGVDLSYRETNRLSIMSALGNFFGPILGGASIRAVYLKKSYGLEISKFVSTLYAFYLVSFISNSFIGLLLLTQVGDNLKSGSGFVSIISIFTVIFVTGLGFLLIKPTIMRKIFSIKLIPARIKKMLNLMIDGWESIKSESGTIVKLIMLNLGILLIVVLESSVLYSLFVDNFSISTLLLYSVIGSLSMLLSITPGAIGIKESLFLLTSTLLMVNPEEVVQMATIDRGVTFFTLLIMFLLMKIFKSDTELRVNEAKK